MFTGCKNHGKPGEIILSHGWDFRDRSTFKPALEEKEILFPCGPSATPEAEELLKPLVEEAINQNIKHVVFIASYPSLMER